MADTNPDPPPQVMNIVPLADSSALLKVLFTAQLSKYPSFDSQIKPEDEAVIHNVTLITSLQLLQALLDNIHLNEDYLNTTIPIILHCAQYTKTSYMFHIICIRTLSIIQLYLAKRYHTYYCLPLLTQFLYMYMDKYNNPSVRSSIITFFTRSLQQQTSTELLSPHFAVLLDKAFFPTIGDSQDIGPFAAHISYNATPLLGDGLLSSSSSSLAKDRRNSRRSTTTHERDVRITSIIPPSNTGYLRFIQDAIFNLISLLGTRVPSPAQIEQIKKFYSSKRDLFTLQCYIDSLIALLPHHINPLQFSLFWLTPLLRLLSLLTSYYQSQPQSNIYTQHITLLRGVLSTLINSLNYFFHTALTTSHPVYDHYTNNPLQTIIRQRITQSQGQYSTTPESHQNSPYIPNPAFLDNSTEQTQDSIRCVLSNLTKPKFLHDIIFCLSQFAQDYHDPSVQNGINSSIYLLLLGMNTDPDTIRSIPSSLRDMVPSSPLSSQSGAIGATSSSSSHMSSSSSSLPTPSPSYSTMITHDQFQQLCKDYTDSLHSNHDIWGPILHLIHELSLYPGPNSTTKPCIDPIPLLTLASQLLQTPHIMIILHVLIHDRGIIDVLQKAITTLGKFLVTNTQGTRRASLACLDITKQNTVIQSEKKDLQSLVLQTGRLLSILVLHCSILRYAIPQHTSTSNNSTPSSSLQYYDSSQPNHIISTHRNKALAWYSAYPVSPLFIRYQLDLFNIYRVHRILYPPLIKYLVQSNNIPVLDLLLTGIQSQCQLLDDLANGPSNMIPSPYTINSILSLYDDIIIYSVGSFNIKGISDDVILSSSSSSSNSNTNSSSNTIDGSSSSRTAIDNAKATAAAAVAAVSSNKSSAPPLSFSTHLNTHPTAYIGYKREHDLIPLFETEINSYLARVSCIVPHHVLIPPPPLPIVQTVSSSSSTSHLSTATTTSHNFLTSHRSSSSATSRKNRYDRDHSRTRQDSLSLDSQQQQQQQARSRSFSRDRSLDHHYQNQHDRDLSSSSSSSHPFSQSGAITSISHHQHPTTRSRGGHSSQRLIDHDSIDDDTYTATATTTPPSSQAVSNDDSSGSGGYPSPLNLTESDVYPPPITPLLAQSEGYNTDIASLSMIQDDPLHVSGDVSCYPTMPLASVVSTGTSDISTTTATATTVTAVEPPSATLRRRSSSIYTSSVADLPSEKVSHSGLDLIQVPHLTDIHGYPHFSGIPSSKINISIVSHLLSQDDSNNKAVLKQQQQQQSNTNISLSSSAPPSTSLASRRIQSTPPSGTTATTATNNTSSTPSVQHQQYRISRHSPHGIDLTLPSPPSRSPSQQQYSSSSSSSSYENIVFLFNSGFVLPHYTSVSPMYQIDPISQSIVPAHPATMIALSTQPSPALSPAPISLRVSRPPMLSLSSYAHYQEQHNAAHAAPCPTPRTTILNLMQSGSGHSSTGRHNTGQHHHHHTSHPTVSMTSSSSSLLPPSSIPSLGPHNTIYQTGTLPVTHYHSSTDPSSSGAASTTGAAAAVTSSSSSSLQAVPLSSISRPTSGVAQPPRLARGHSVSSHITPGSLRSTSIQPSSSSSSSSSISSQQQQYQPVIINMIECINSLKWLYVEYMLTRIRLLSNTSIKITPLSEHGSYTTLHSNNTNNTNIITTLYDDNQHVIMPYRAMLAQPTGSSQTLSSSLLSLAPILALIPAAYCIWKWVLPRPSSSSSSSLASVSLLDDTTTTTIDE